MHFWPALWTHRNVLKCQLRQMESATKLICAKAESLENIVVFLSLYGCKMLLKEKHAGNGTDNI